MKLSERIMSYFAKLEKHPIKMTKLQTRIIDNNHMELITEKGDIVPIEFSINNNTITISTPMMIVINAGMYAVKTEYGIHLNPDTTNVDELKWKYNSSQKNIIDHCEDCEKPVRVPFKQQIALAKARREQKFRRG